MEDYFTSLELELAYDFPIANETTLKNMANVSDDFTENDNIATTKHTNDTGFILAQVMYPCMFCIFLLDKLWS